MLFHAFILDGLECLVGSATHSCLYASLFDWIHLFTLREYLNRGICHQKYWPTYITEGELKWRGIALPDRTFGMWTAYLQCHAGCQGSLVPYDLETRCSDNDRTLRPLDQRMDKPLMKTVTGLHEPITWPTYLGCVVAQGQAHIASPSRLHTCNG